MDAPPAPLLDRLRSVAAELCGSLDAVLRSALAAADVDLGQGLRPVQLTSTLGLDKSLASRVVRSLGADDPLRALHGIPTPQGLALVETAARERGTGDRELARLAEATEAYRELLGEFSGGRTDLEATLAGYIPEQRERAERDARRSVFRGMTTLSGTRSSAVYNALYLLPSREPGRVDSLLVAVRQDLRRLRAGARLLVASIAAQDASRRRTPLGSEGAVSDPRELLLADLCSHPVPALHLDHTDERMLLAIDPGALDVNEMATIGMGWRTEANFPRGPEPDGAPSALTMTAHGPTEALVADLLLHRDVTLEAPPVAVVLDNLALHPSPARALLCASAPDGSIRRTELTDLSASPSGLSSPHVRACSAIAETACREAGVEVGAFRGYRATIPFPTPTEALTLCWRAAADS